MTSETVFRAIFIAVLAVDAAIGFSHRLRASGEKISRREEGLLILIPLRLSGLVWFLTAILYMIHPPWVRWASMPVPEPLRWMAAGVCLLSPLLIYWVFSNLGPNVTDTVVTRKEAYLVTTGPYRWVRHPLYAMLFFLWPAWSLLAANWLLLAVLPVPVILLVIRTDKEEAFLIAKFGDAYREYMARTGRFFPRL